MTKNRFIESAKTAASRDAYEWDVFVSYTRSEILAYWVDNYFHPQLRDWIRNEYGIREPRIFIDRHDVRTGDEWEKKLGIALRTSICMVPILTAEYCRSRWCRTEWKAFAAREKQLTKLLAKTASGLIYPVKFSDGEHFESWIMKKQIFDLSEWAYSSPAFKSSAEYMPFERAMRTFVRTIPAMRSILTAPPAPPINIKIKKERSDRPTPSEMLIPRYRDA